MNSAGHDPDPEANAFRVIEAAEELVGEDRFGGAWIDRTESSRPAVGIAVVDPSERDVDAISSTARDAGCAVHIVAVRYSQMRPIGMLEGLQRTRLPGDSWVGLGWDPRMNCIVADLRSWDVEAVSWLCARLPNDALIVRIHPGASWRATTA